jgi:hypothetical protein
MADFLFRLAQRALGDGQAVRPILLPGAMPEPAEPMAPQPARRGKLQAPSSKLQAVTIGPDEARAAKPGQSSEPAAPSVQRVSRGPAPTLRLPEAPVRQDERIRRKPLPVAPSAVARQPLVPPPSSSVESGHDARPALKAAAAPPESMRPRGIDPRPAPHVAPVGRVSPDGQGYRSSSIVHRPSFSTKGDVSRDDVAPAPLRLVAPRPVDQHAGPAQGGATEAVSGQRSAVGNQRSAFSAQPLLLVPQPHATAARRGQPPAGAVMPDIEGRRSAGQLPIVNRQSPISRGAEARPVVRVTIGRVEVRAVTPPAPVPPRAAPPRARKTLSLDEYLGQRNRGER